jgi:formylglycine-generating enzyme required for sulfatase activity
MTPKPTPAPLSDQPAVEDQLGFAPYAKTLADIVADPFTETPLTIGVFGDWGMGKTSLMRMIARRVRDEPVVSQTEFPVETLWFNAWLYSREDTLWRALLLRVVDGVRPLVAGQVQAGRDLDRIAAQLTQATEPGGGPWLTVPSDTLRLASPSELRLPLVAGLRLLQEQPEGGELTDLIQAVERAQARAMQQRIAALDEFRRTLEQVSQQHIVKNGRLVVFVDDLDRCLPDKAVEVLEAIKLFLDVPECIFVLGVDRQVVERGIKVRYRDFGEIEAGRAVLEGARYLEKIIQIPFSLPPVKVEAMRGFVEQIGSDRLTDPRCAEIFARGLTPNPRRFKRTLNIFLLLERLAANNPDLGDRIKPLRLAKIVIIQQYHPRLFRLLVEGSHYLKDLERLLRDKATREKTQETERGTVQSVGDGGTPPGSGTGTGDGSQISAGPLEEFLGNRLLQQLLTWPAEGEPDANFVDLTPEQVSEYIYLTRSSVQEAEPAAEARRLEIESQMVTIPAGPFLMGTPESEREELLAQHRAAEKNFDVQWLDNEIGQHEVDLPTYAIGRDPVTNAEFRRFIEAGGYAEQDYWTEAGWQQKKKENWTQPRYWEDEDYNQPDQPVVGVSWYEALAYCRWLSAETGREYRLPREAEWEKAARGSDGRRYPWGNDWDPARLNSREGGPGRPSTVGQHSPSGDSPYGIRDMAGNVWEWCSTRWGGRELRPQFGYPYHQDEREDFEGDDTRILRGGSWYDPQAVCRCGCRARFNPASRYIFRGFRCARTLS